VASLWDNSGWHIPFHRVLGLRERVEWVNLMRGIEAIRPADSPGRMTWVLEPSGRFTVRSLYRKLCEGTPSKFFVAIWHLAIPSRIRIFLWQLARKRLPTNDNIRQRRGPSTGRCALCGEIEDTNHIFFECGMAKFMWSAVRKLLSCSWNPSCFADMCRLLHGQTTKMKRVLGIYYAALCWTLWNLRNKFTIEGIFPTQPADSLYKLSMYLQV
jgi:hypothetical protein